MGSLDTPTLIAATVICLLIAAVAWWLVADLRKERRRERAALWAQSQISPERTDKHHQAEVTDEIVPLDLWPTEELAPPDLVRPYMWMADQTDVLPIVRDND